MSEPRKPYDAIGARNDADLLGAALALWETRDDSQAQPEIRRAANTAMDEIDIMLLGLQLMRAKLADEIRASDAAAMARADALLAQPATLPNPGSVEARDRGCICPVIDNGHGMSRPPGGWVIARGCPVHVP